MDHTILSETRSLQGQEHFDWLIAPMTPESFFEAYWEKKPLHLSRNAPDRHASLFSLEALDELLGFSRTNTNVRTAWQGHSNSPVIWEGAHKTSICEMYDFYYQGQTIVVRNIHKRWPAIGKLCNAIACTLGCRVGTHLYATPEASQGFGIHWDDHDIFALQIEGEKEWCLYDSGPTLPRKSKNNREYLRQVIEDPGDPAMEVLLKAGDLLYFPRGVIHRARAQQAPSLHLTFGIYSVTWEDALIEALDAAKHPELEASLEPGFLAASLDPNQLASKLRPVIQEIRETVDFESVNGLLAESVLNHIEAPPAGHFKNVCEHSEIQPDTRLEKRPGMVCYPLDSSEGCKLVFPGGSHFEPSNHRRALHFIAEHQAFRLDEIPELSPKQAHVLVGTLLVKGLLQAETESCM